MINIHCFHVLNSQRINKNIHIVYTEVIKQVKVLCGGISSEGDTLQVVRRRQGK